MKLANLNSICIMCMAIGSAKTVAQTDLCLIWVYSCVVKCSCYSLSTIVNCVEVMTRKKASCFLSFDVHS